MYCGTLTSLVLKVSHIDYRNVHSRIQYYLMTHS